MSLGVRLLKFIESIRMNKTQFAKSLGYQRSDNIQNIINGHTTQPSSNLLIDIIRHYPELNARWLLTGEGEMLNSYSNKEDNNNIIYEPQNSYGSKCDNCAISKGEIKRLVIDRKELIDRLESQSEQLGKLKEKLSNL